MARYKQYFRFGRIILQRGKNSDSPSADLLPSYPGGFDGLPTWNITDETITLSEEAEDDRE